MEKTAMAKFADKIGNRITLSPEEWKQFEIDVKNALAEERQQIEDAYKNGFNEGIGMPASDYYNNKYGEK